jgi:SPOR domain
MCCAATRASVPDGCCTFAIAIALRLRSHRGRQFQQRVFEKMRVITIVVAVCLVCGPLAAQQFDPAAAVQSRKAYDDCVYESVAAQLQQIPVSVRRNVDMSYLGEQGFVACATEERVLGMTLTINNVSPQIAQAALLGIRAQIKRTLHQIVANSKNKGDPQRTTGVGVTGGYLVQVASKLSEIDAKTSYQELQDKFPAVLGSRSPLIKRADLGDRGVYYRAFVGPFGTPDEASLFCGSLKTAGGQCVVQRN